jgi:hypothetical protein
MSWDTLRELTADQGKARFTVVGGNNTMVWSEGPIIVGQLFESDRDREAGYTPYVVEPHTGSFKLPLNWCFI